MKIPSKMLSMILLAVLGRNADIKVLNAPCQFRRQRAAITHQVVGRNTIELHALVRRVPYDTQEAGDERGDDSGRKELLPDEAQPTAIPFVIETQAAFASPITPTSSSTALVTRRRSSPSAMMRISGSVPDGRMTRRP